MDIKSELISWAEAPDDWEPDWHIKPIWQKNGLNFIFGAPKCHKTMLRRYLLACAIAKSPAFDKFEIRHPIENALIMLMEDHEGAEKGKMLSVFREVGFSSKPPVTFYPAFKFSLCSPKAIDSLAKLIETEGFDFVVMDPFVHFHNVPENDNTAMSNVLVTLRNMARELATMCIVHHTSKPPQQSQGPSERTVGESARGATAIPGAADAQLKVTKTGKGWRHQLAFENKNEEPENFKADLNPQTWCWSEAHEISAEIVLKAVKKKPGINMTQLRDTLGYQKKDVTNMVAGLIDSGQLTSVQGKQGAKNLFVASWSEAGLGNQ